MSDSTMMSRARWQRIQELFEGASALKDAQRQAWLAERCGTDGELRDHVLALLASGSDAAFAERVDRAIAATWSGIDAIEPGQLIGRYRIIRILGRGGMGAVYLAERADEQFRQQVALKLVERVFSGDALTRRLRAERQILANLNHPNIARLLDGGASDAGVPYLAMEYVEGLRVDHYCARHRLDIKQRLRLFQQICAAVQYAHQNLVVHRDIKPSNILVTADGVPKLLDFGIAKLLDPQPGSDLDGLTRVHERILTPEHASPEQMRGERVGTVSDVYSLGVLLYQLLTGRTPYTLADMTYEQMQRVICDLEPPRPSAAARAAAAPVAPRTLSGDLDNIVLRALHKEPQRRYPSAAALAEDIERYLDDRPVQARPDALSYRLGKFARRNAAALAASATATAVIIGLTIYYTASLAAQRDAAERERATSTAVSSFMQEVFRVANPSEARGNSVTVREVLDVAVERIDTDLRTEPRVHATLLRTMGQVYNGLGLWPQARALLLRAVAEERASFGEQHLELAAALESLASIEQNQNGFDAALADYHAAWQIRSALGRDRDADAATLLSATAGTLRALQRYPQALEYHQRAEALARALEPPQPRVLGQVLQGYAMTYLLVGEEARAEQLARASLELTRNVVYQGIDLYANSIYALAESLRKQYKLEEAGQLQHELLELQIERLGPDAPMVGRTWNNLSHVLRARGQYGEAQAALLRALAIAGKQPDIALDPAVMRHNLGGLQLESGQPQQALQSLLEALALKERATGVRSPQLISTLLEISAARRELGDLAGARAAVGRAESVAQATMQPNEKRYASLHTERARLALALGDSAAAEAAARAALALVDEQEPGRLATIQCVLAEALARRGRLPQARQLLEQALETRRRIMPAEHWMIADAESRLGEIAALQGSPQAHALLERSLHQLQADRPAGDSYLLAAKLRLQRMPR